MGVMNELINPGVVGSLERILAAASPGHRFPQLAGTAGQLDGLSLRERTDLLSGAMLTDLPGGYPAAAAVFRRALQDPEFTGWMIWPVSEAAATLALARRGPADFEDCLSLLAELTPRLTGEFAIRRLLGSDLDRALTVIQHWTTTRTGRSAGSPARVPGRTCRGLSGYPGSRRGRQQPCRSWTPCTATRSRMSGDRWPTT
jgi:hypothetical protein